jgi:hypothetical protein
MTGFDLPTREELLQLAPLEALGLLDELEDHRFARGFEVATPTVQDEIRDLQAAVAVEFGSAGVEGPERALRFKTLAAMSAAVEADDESCAPIASIGERAAMQMRRRSQLVVEGDAIAATRRDRDRRSSIFWRAAALALGSGLLVTLYFTNQLSSTARNLAQLVLLDLNKSDLRSQIGPSYSKFIESGSASAISLGSQSGSGAGVLFIEPSSNEALFLAFDIGDQVGPFRLIARDATSGEEIELAVVDSFSKLAAVQFDLGSVPAGSNFVLMDVNGEEILSSKFA